MTRRNLLAGAALAAAPQTPIIDTHIHLFDVSRPQGVPWPPKDNPILYKTALPSRFREVTKGLGVTGAIEVECSPWLEDNQWVLDVMAGDTIMVGTIGDLEPADPAFPKQLERFTKNPLFLGIRYGYLWNRDLRAQIEKPAFVEGIRLLAKAGLTLDTANPSTRVLEDIIRLTDRVPDLRVVIDHLPKLVTPAEAAARRAYDTALAEVGKRRKVYVKLSAVLTRTNGRVSHDLADYRPKLDELFETFGEDRVVYGSDWPNSAPLGSYAEVLAIVKKYFATKSLMQAEKYFWRNSVEAYRWVRRDGDQPPA